MQPIAADLFVAGEAGPQLIGGRRRSDGKIVFPLMSGSEREFYEPMRLSPTGTLWSFTVQRFRPKSPPYAGADDERSFKPYAVGYIELAGQVIVETRLDVDDFSLLKIGMPMRLVVIPFAHRDGLVSTYAFRPIEESQL